MEENGTENAKLATQRLVCEVATALIFQLSLLKNNSEL